MDCLLYLGLFGIIIILWIIYIKINCIGLVGGGVIVVLWINLEILYI